MILTKLVNVAVSRSWKELLQATLDSRRRRRNTSTCKRALQRVQARLSHIKNRRISIVKHDRRAVSQFVTNGDVNSAFLRAEQILEDENMIRLHQLLHDFCIIAVANLSSFLLLRRNNNNFDDCPDEVREAFFTLAFAAPRCRDLPELQTVRWLFLERYAGCEEDDRCNGSLVNLEVKERLAAAAKGATVSYEEKRRKVSEIIGEDWDETRRERRIARAASAPLLQLGCCGTTSEDDDEVEVVGVVRRTVSVPRMLPSHVHPKLPEWDDLEAKFRALKEEHAMAKLSVGEPPAPIMHISDY